MENVGENLRYLLSRSKVDRRQWSEQLGAGSTATKDILDGGNLTPCEQERDALDSKRLCETFAALQRLVK